jgi:hypothetical protein
MRAGAQSYLGIVAQVHAPAKLKLFQGWLEHLKVLGQIGARQATGDNCNLLGSDSGRGKRTVAGCSDRGHRHCEPWPLMIPGTALPKTQQSALAIRDKSERF